MDPLLNPYSPGAGAPPPELVGRDPILEAARILLGRIRKGRPEKSILLTGLRGVGKTVLLNEIERTAKETGYRTVLIEAQEDVALGPLIVPQIRTLLYELDRMAGAADKAKRGLRVLRSFLGSIKLDLGDISIGLDIEPETGTADSGSLAADLTSLFVAVAEAAADRGTAVAVLVDELQYFSEREFGALIMAMHRLQQLALPMLLVGAGLPVLPALAGNAKSYAERLFRYPQIGELSREDACRALRDPARASGADFEDAALDEVYAFTRGYPYFLQEWGYQAWNLSPGPLISAATVATASSAVVSRLDENFFRVRFDRLTPGEKRYLRAMADLGAGPCRTGDIADRLGVKVSSLGPVRAKLIKKGMVYSPAHGEMAFTVPLFDEFMVRVMPGEGWAG
jgi:hypothetical protein